MDKAKNTVIGILCLLLAFEGVARAQFGGGGGGVTQAQLDAVEAKIPTAASMVPPTDSASGAVGAVTNQFARPDAVRPSRVRNSSCTLVGTTGQCDLVWSSPFAVTPAPLGDPSAINANFATLQYNCNWIAPGPTTTGGKVGCRASVLGLAILGNTWTLLAGGTTVFGTAVQPL